MLTKPTKTDAIAELEQRIEAVISEHTESQEQRSLRATAERLEQRRAEVAAEISRCEAEARDRTRTPTGAWATAILTGDGVPPEILPAERLPDLLAEHNAVLAAIETHQIEVSRAQAAAAERISGGLLPEYRAAVRELAGAFGALVVAHDRIRKARTVLRDARLLDAVLPVVQIQGIPSEHDPGGTYRGWQRHMVRLGLVEPKQ